jgi:Xaa-Pro aminopeptidase
MYLSLNIGLTNLRGNDIEYNPLFFSYGILYLEKDREYLNLYANKQKFNSEEIQEHLKQNNITLYEYSEIYTHLKEKSLTSFKFIIDQESCNQYINSIAKSNPNLDIKYFDNDLIEDTKGIKTPREIQGFRDCHLRDGVAIVRYLAWLENEILNNKRTDITEYSGTLQLLAFRKEQELFMGESFNTISSSGANAAIIHYKPEKATCSVISKDQIYLLDSGGQYLDGTTDTTRTVHFGTPSAYEKEMYTRVLLGNLSLERLNFLKRWNLNGINLFT